MHITQLIIIQWQGIKMYLPNLQWHNENETETGVVYVIVFSDGGQVCKAKSWLVITQVEFLVLSIYSFSSFFFFRSM